MLRFITAQATPDGPTESRLILAGRAYARMVKRLLEATAGQPFLIQRICFDLIKDLEQRREDADFDRSLEPPEPRIRLADVERLLPNVLEPGDQAAYYFEGVYGQVAPGLDRTLLQHLAESGAPRTLDEIVQAAGVPETDAREALRRLARLDVLAYDERAETWRYRIDLMRRWILQRDASGAPAEDPESEP